MVPFANFSTAEFKNAKATQKGESVDATHVKTVAIDQSTLGNKKQTSQQARGNRVTVKYISKG